MRGPSEHECGPRHARRERFPLGFYVRARLHRRLFLYFGMTILATGIIVSIVMGLVFERHHSHGPMRLLVPLITTLAVIWAATGKIARRLARPLADVARVAQEIGQGKLESRMRLDRFTPGEVGILAESINEMAVRIERQLNDQRVLLAAVSHELRTPLGHARILLEILRGKGADGHSLGELERELVEIDTLVGELLASSRLDFSVLSARPIDAVDLAERALDRAGLERSRLEISGSRDQRTFSADPTLMGRALANLLDNAVKHGGGVVALRLDLGEARLRFEVDDAGPGIPADRDVFTPFYRGQEARAGNGTLGLGLSLVRRIAEAHRGSAFAGSRAAGGARVGLEVPRASEPSSGAAPSPKPSVDRRPSTVDR